jgi:hypothetical protein
MAFTFHHLPVDCFRVCRLTFVLLSVRQRGFGEETSSSIGVGSELSVEVGGTVGRGMAMVWSMDRVLGSNHVKGWVHLEIADQASLKMVS